MAIKKLDEDPKKKKKAVDTKNFYGTAKRAMRKTTPEEKFQLGVDSVQAGKFHKNTLAFEKKYPKSTRSICTPTSCSPDTTTGKKFKAISVKPYPKKTAPVTKAPPSNSIKKTPTPIKKTALINKPTPTQKKIIKKRENYSGGKLISKEYQDSTGKWIKQ
jgi:hypothetical protein